MNVLGISCGFHDGAAALVVDGQTVAAVEQERLTRVKHDPSFPDRAVDTCMSIAGLELADVDLVAFHEKPLGVVNRHLTTRIGGGPGSVPALLTSTPKVVRDQLTVGHQIARHFRRRGVRNPPVHFIEHHASHAAAAFYPSPFASSAVLTVDGVGEWATATAGDGHMHRLRVDRELRFPDSVGLLYSAFAAYCGFRVNSGEGELMGLAPFGEPRYVDRILAHLVDLRPDGSIRLDQRYFGYTRGRSTINRRFERLFDGPARPRGAKPTRREADLARSIQVVLEEIVLAMAREAHRETGRDALCMSGGVALNCVANGRVLRDGPFDDIWIQPAAGDAGSALGAALYSWHETLGNRREPPDGRDGMSGAFLGPSFTRAEVGQWLRSSGIPHRVVECDDRRADEVADRIARGAVVGWFQGRMEFGPRALGHRSILADPRSPTVQQRINGLVKERAGFRPFAPAVLSDRVAEWFEHTGSAPYMTLAVPVRADRRVAAPQPADPDDLESVVAQVRSTIPAVTHVDGSARIQTVDRDVNPEFARLIAAFDRRTGCPVVLNTSFNARDEPVVCTPDDAYRTFRRVGLDLLVVEDCLVEAIGGR